MASISTHSPSKSSGGRQFHQVTPLALSPRSKPPPPFRDESVDTLLRVSSPLSVLPPLPSPSSSSPASPRTFRPPPPLHFDYPVAQLDSWPLTSASYGQNASPSKSSTSLPSPLSPRMRKVHAHHKLLEESKSKPVLLQELQAFLVSELAAIGQSGPENDDDGSSVEKPLNLTRLQIFRELFSRVIDAFSVYAPLLARIKAEYDAAVETLMMKCQLVPQLHSELQSLEAQCLQELSKHQLETTLRLKTLKHSLKQTQAQLAACAAQNAHLNDEKTKLTDHLKRLEQRHEEMQQSNHALVSGLKRQDETLRHIHDRSRDEGAVLQQMTLKYHRACDEIAELKQTVAKLEDKVGGVHIAADKATITLLMKEIQELHGKLQASGALEQKHGDVSPQQEALMKLFNRVLEANGATTTRPSELLEMIKLQSLNGGSTGSAIAVNKANRSGSILSTATGSMVSAGSLSTRQSTASLASLSTEESIAAISSGDLAFGIDGATRLLSDQFTRFHEQRQQIIHRTQQQQAANGGTFLTEPEEITSFTNAHVLLSTTDFIQTKGTGSDVPEYLQYDGVVRHLYFDRRRVELLLSKVWAHKDDLDGKAKRSQPHQAASSTTVSLASAFSLYMQRCFPGSKHDQIECAYNVLASLEQFADASCDCRVFLLTLRGQLPDEARADQAKELVSLHDALFALHRELKTEPTAHRHGHDNGLPIAEVVRALRRQFPWKSDAQLSALHRALLLDQRGQTFVDYGSLLNQTDGEPHSHSNRSALKMTARKPRTKSVFAECLRAQYIDDLLGFRQHIERHVQQTISENDAGDENASSHGEDASGNATVRSMVSVRVLRECLQRCDAAKPVQEINHLLSVATGLSMDQILTEDAMMISAQQFLQTLPTLLVKPSGKFTAAGLVAGTIADGAAASVSGVVGGTTSTSISTVAASVAD